MPSIFNTEITKILKILYSEYIQENYKCSYELINRTKRRISDSLYLIDGSIIDKMLDVHSNKICLMNPLCEKCEIRKFCQYYRSNARESISQTAPTMVDLFCGAGGFSLGFDRVGFRILYAIDNQEPCIETYKLNHFRTEEGSIVCKDISEINNDLVKIKENKEIDVIIGGPPCQGFSNANRQRLINDPRNKLYKHFVDAIDQLNPKYFVMENVRGILNIKEEIIEDFKKLEHPFNVIPIKLNASDFGIPQNRQRVFFIGTRTNSNLNDLLYRIKEIGSLSKSYKLDDALIGLRELNANTQKHSTSIDCDNSGKIIDINSTETLNSYLLKINNGNRSKIIFNHKARYNNDRDIEIFSKLNPGDSSDDPKIASIMPYSNRNHIFRDKYYRLNGDKLCKTITAHMKFDCNMYIHPRQSRGLTPREAARVQSYPDDYYFTGPFTKTYMQIGNSVPPLLSMAIAQAIKEFL